jgi:CTP:molybdopterin cytidylyltransferase MocA
VIAGLVLAAGAATRMGRPKIGLDVAGRPMVVRVVEAALAGGLTDVVVVVPLIPEISEPLGAAPAHGAAESHGTADPWESARLALRLLERPELRVVPNPDAAAGQSTSLRVGLEAMAEGTEAAVVLLADQPLIRPDAVEAVVSAFRVRPAAVVQAAYRGRLAHPTLLARELWPALTGLTGDQGARDVIAEHPEWRSLTEVGGSPPMDVDTDADYERLLRITPFLPF